MLELRLPKERFSAIDFLMEQGNPSKYKGILLTVSAYNRTKEATCFKQQTLEDGEVWTSNTLIIDEIHHPSICYAVQKHQDGYIVPMLGYDRREYFFSTTEYDVRIDY